MGLFNNDMFSSKAVTPIKVKVSRWAPFSTNMLIDKLERIGYKLIKGEDVTNDWGYLHFEGPWGKHSEAKIIIEQMAKSFPNQVFPPTL